MSEKLSAQALAGKAILYGMKFSKDKDEFLELESLGKKIKAVGLLKVLQEQYIKDLEAYKPFSNKSPYSVPGEVALNTLGNSAIRIGEAAVAAALKELSKDFQQDVPLGVWIDIKEKMIYFVLPVVQVREDLDIVFHIESSKSKASVNLLAKKNLKFKSLGTLDLKGEAKWIPAKAEVELKLTSTLNWKPLKISFSLKGTTNNVISEAKVVVHVKEFVKNIGPGQVVIKGKIAFLANKKDQKIKGDAVVLYNHKVLQDFQVSLGFQGGVSLSSKGVDEYRCMFLVGFDF